MPFVMPQICDTGLPELRNQTDQNVFLQIKGTVEKDLRHLFITGMWKRKLEATNFCGSGSGKKVPLPLWPFISNIKT